MRLPGKSSRTSTHAMIVPITTLISATITETNNVTRNDAKATGAVTASQNPEIPSSNAVAGQRGERKQNDHGEPQSGHSDSERPHTPRDPREFSPTSHGGGVNSVSPRQSYLVALS